MLFWPELWFYKVPLQHGFLVCTLAKLKISGHCSLDIFRSRDTNLFSVSSFNLQVSKFRFSKWPKKEHSFGDWQGQSQNLQWRTLSSCLCSLFLPSSLGKRGCCHIPASLNGPPLNVETGVKGTCVSVSSSLPFPFPALPFSWDLTYLGIPIAGLRVLGGMDFSWLPILCIQMPVLFHKSATMWLSVAPS